jgi:NAD(P)-dependent dehydrogenase (short-subunit alcohol dehydrogenase family)
MPSSTGFTAADVSDQSGKCFLVTGANTGIGFEVSRVLAARGARVLLACRDKAKAEAAMAWIRHETPGADLAFLPLDQSDLASVRRAAELAGQEPRIDVLINNAGAMIPTRKLTKQGFELHFGVNHLGSFALTALLLPKLKQTPGPRIVLTSSGLHKDAKIDWDDLNAERSFSGIPRYAASKLANLLFVFELDRRLRAAGLPVSVVASHPGLAATGIGNETVLSRIVMPFVRLLLNTAAQGAWGTLHAATGQVTPGGYYGAAGFRELRGPSRECIPSAQARDPRLARWLWDVSVRMTGIDPGLSHADETAPQNIPSSEVRYG